MTAELLQRTLATGLATIFDIAPILLTLLVFQLLILRRPIANLRRIVLGGVYAFVGLTLFVVGLEEALFPLGKTMAAQLTAAEVTGAAGALGWSLYGWVYAFAAAIGFATTIAEPGLLAVALKAHQVSGGILPVWGLRIAVAIGVAVGCFRIVTGTPVPLYIILGYVIVMLQTLTAPRLIVPLAFDSGGVTTSTVTVPVVTALGLGLAAAIPGRNPLIDGFGLIAFASLFPIMTVLAYAWLADRLARRHGAADTERPA